MKLASWNVNGLRACAGKGFAESFADLDADVLCLQETKMQPGQLDISFEGYSLFLSSAEKKGYSGTAMFTRIMPLAITYGMGVEEHDNEGRIILAEFEDFYLVTVYTPNAQRELVRLDYRMRWEDDFRAYVTELDRHKPVVICGDLNVAHREIDLKNPRTNVNNAGFTPQEREKFTLLLESGFTDTFRHVHGDVTGAYSWWSYMFNARQNNTGWRIDYFLTSNRLVPRIRDAAIRSDIMGSDHCPVVLELE